MKKLLLIFGILFSFQSMAGIHFLLNGFGGYSKAVVYGEESAPSYSGTNVNLELEMKFGAKTDFGDGSLSYALYFARGTSSYENSNNGGGITEELENTNQGFGIKIYKSTTYLKIGFEDLTFKDTATNSITYTLEIEGKSYPIGLYRKFDLGQDFKAYVGLEARYTQLEQNNPLYPRLDFFEYGLYLGFGWVLPTSAF